jgi:hypothetical protein
MKFNKNRIGKTIKILERLRYRDLKIPQIIDEMKICVLQSRLFNDEQCG